MMLFTVAVVIDIARAFQRDFIRGLRTALRLRWLRFGRAGLDGFAGLIGISTGDRT